MIADYGSDLFSHLLGLELDNHNDQFRGPDGGFQPYLKKVLTALEDIAAYDPLVKDRVSTQVKNNPWDGIKTGYPDFLAGKVFFHKVSQAELVKLRVDNKKLHRNLGLANLPTIGKSKLLTVSAEDSFMIVKNRPKKAIENALKFVNLAFEKNHVRSWMKYTAQAHASSLSKNIKVRKKGDFLGKLIKTFDKIQNFDKRWDKNIAMWTCNKKNDKNETESFNIYSSVYPMRGHVVPKIWLGEWTKKSYLAEVNKLCNAEKKLSH